MIMPEALKSAGQDKGSTFAEIIKFPLMRDVLLKLYDISKIIAFNQVL